VKPPAVAPPLPAAGQPTRTYRVQRRDTLWGIAQRQLGDRLRWSHVYALNHGCTMADGQVFDDPNRIWPGWTLLLPANPPAAEPVPAVPPVPDAPPTPAPRQPANPVPATPTAPSISPDAARHTPQPAALPASPAPPTQHGAPVQVRPVELPSGSFVAGSFAAGVAAALALGRLRRHHAYRPREPQQGRCLAPSPLGPTLRRLSTAAQCPADHDDEGGRPEQPTVALASDDPVRREQPDLIDVGIREGEAVSLAPGRAVRHAWPEARVITCGGTVLRLAPCLAHREDRS